MLLPCIFCTLFHIFLYRALTNVNDALRKRISLLESQIQNNNVRIENVESSLVDVNNKCANQFDDSKKGKLPPELTVS